MKRKTAEKHPMQPIRIDPEGVARFKENKIVRFLLDRGRFDMNDLALMNFSRDDRAQFAQLIGYYVSGFCELSYTSLEDASAADLIVSGLMVKHDRRTNKRGAR